MTPDICPDCGKKMEWKNDHYECVCGAIKIVNREKRENKQGGK